MTKLGSCEGDEPKTDEANSHPGLKCMYWVI